MLSPELYLGVVPIKSGDGSVAFNRKGKIVEYAVKMVELPQSARMDNLIKEEKVEKDHIERIAEILEEFHRKTKAAPRKYRSTKIARCDVAAEIAFLAMDLHIYDKKKWADVLVRKYIQFSGDEDIHRLIDFYMCYRALVEALVETYTIDDPEIGENKKRKAKKACKRYLDLAFAFADKIRCAL